MLGKFDGIAEGRDEGYGSGYEDGYIDGVDYGYAASDSAALGKNLLGETFSAPLEALKQFEIVGWTTSSGRVVSISVMTVVSAIVAVGLLFLFIKMFSGG